MFFHHSETIIWAAINPTTSSTPFNTTISAVLTKKPGHCLGLHKLAGLIEVIVYDGFGIDTESVVNGSEEFARMHGVYQRCGTRLVRLPVDVTSFDTATGDAGRVAIRPVVAAIITVAVS